MCPLRVVLIFLSATLAGFFVVRGLRAPPDPAEHDAGGFSGIAENEPLPLHAKVRSGISSGFWTCVDMASGQYLWRHLACSSSTKKTKKEQ